jgi:hypothetical protein
MAAMRHRWSADTEFTRLVLEVEDEACARCGKPLHVCDHRRHRIFTLQGPVELVCKLAHCCDQSCAGHAKTLSPYAELTLTLPWWLIGWDVFCWMGQRRFSRHWSVPQIRSELLDSYRIPLSADAIEDGLQRYQVMLAARQQDAQVVASAYQGVEGLVLSIDGLQPEKGHETLYVVRELRAKRVWFAEPLLSSGAEEVRRLLRQARDWAAQLGLPVQLWLSDKQDAFVSGIAAEFPGVPHRYCSNHFLRDLGKPMLEADSHAKVRLRSKVRGLRTIEREILQQRRSAVVEAAAESAVVETAAESAVVETAPESAVVETAPESAVVEAASESAVVETEVGAPLVPTSASTVASVAESLAERSAVVLDYCSMVRGILNDDQGGPLEPPGLRMAEALGEVQASLQRNLAANLGGRAHAQLQRLAGCIDRGLSAVQAEQAEVRQQLVEVQRVATTLDPEQASATERQAQFTRLQEEFAGQTTPFYVGMAALMASFAAGLFAGADVLASLHDNLDLERWFRLPKGHERRIHGHKHAGVRLVQEGPTLMLALDAHLAHPGPFTADDLRPYQHAPAPPCQDEAIHRRKVMRKARSKKNAPPC